MVGPPYFRKSIMRWPTEIGLIRLSEQYIDLERSPELPEPRDLEAELAKAAKEQNAGDGSLFVVQFSAPEC